MKTILTIEVSYDDRRTDPEALASAMDTLLETALSIPNVMEEYSPVKVGPFLVQTQTSLGG